MSYDKQEAQYFEDLAQRNQITPEFTRKTRQQLRAEDRAAKKAASRKQPQAFKARKPGEYGPNARTMHMISALSDKFVGKINTYNCPLGCQVVTVDVHPGVTPMRISCQACKVNGIVSAMESDGYTCDQDLSPTHAWRRPPFNSWHTFPKNTQDHLRRGGLELYKIESPK